ncbi:hypothetical protein CI266_002431 [Salmonella enterica subsp. enterica serovar Kotte]|nr:hypothetical protein [Salmonella enterica subsp. enterica serovar Kotte]
MQINRIKRPILLERFGEFLDTNNRLHTAAFLKMWPHRGGFMWRFS